MTESEYVTIMEAARRCGVSDKTIQRAIRQGTLPARYPLYASNLNLRDYH